MFNGRQGLKDIANRFKSIADRFASEADYIVEQVISSGGSSGYTKWNSGKLEQWGNFTFSASNGAVISTITFPTAFINTSFNFTMTGNRNLGTGCYLWEGNSGANVVRTTQSTVVRIVKTGQNYAMGINYKATGLWK